MVIFHSYVTVYQRVDVTAAGVMWIHHLRLAKRPLGSNRFRSSVDLRLHPSRKTIVIMMIIVIITTVINY